MLLLSVRNHDMLSSLLLLWFHGLIVCQSRWRHANAENEIKVPPAEQRCIFVETFNVVSATRYSCRLICLAWFEVRFSSTGAVATSIFWFQNCSEKFGIWRTDGVDFSVVILCELTQLLNFNGFVEKEINLQPIKIGSCHPTHRDELEKWWTFGITVLVHDDSFHLSLQSRKYCVVRHKCHWNVKIFRLCFEMSKEYLFALYFARQANHVHILSILREPVFA